MKKYILLITLLFTSILFAQSKKFVETDELVIGNPQSAAPAGEIRFRNTTQKVRGNKTSGKLEFTNDGSTFKELGSGGGGAGGVNLLSSFNADFETASPPANWTSSGGTFVSDTATEMFGTQSGVWDSSASAQTLCSNATTIERGMIGQKCQAQIYYRWPSGVASDIRMLIKDTGTEIATVSLNPTTSNDVTSTFLTYDCPDTATDTLQMCLESTVSDPAAITVDNAFLGSGNLTITEKPQDVFSATVDTSAVVSAENSDWLTTCTGTTSKTCTFKTGIFSQAPNCVATTVGGAQTAVQTSTLTGFTVDTWSTAGTALNSAFKVICQKTESAANRSAITLETSGSNWSGYHDNTCSWSVVNSASYIDPSADATCSLVQQVNSGFGTVSSVAGLLPGITFTPKYSGKYYACANFRATCATAGLCQMALYEDASNISQIQIQTNANYQVCGIVSANSITSKTVSLKMATTGNVTHTLGGVVGPPAVQAIQWTVYPLSQGFPTPVFTELQDQNTAWSSPVPITLTAVTANPTKGTMARDKIVYYRDGKFMVGYFDFGQTGAGVNGTGSYLITIPGGLSVDTNYVTLNTSETATTLLSPGSLHSSCTGNLGGSGGFVGYIGMYDTTRFRMIGTFSAANLTAWGLGGQNQLSNVTNNMTCHFRIPISGWQ